jgi:hypothetical protein
VVIKSDGQTRLWTAARSEALSERNQLRPQSAVLSFVTLTTDALFAL